MIDLKDGIQGLPVWACDASRVFFLTPATTFMSRFQQTVVVPCFISLHKASACPYCLVLTFSASETSIHVFYYLPFESPPSPVSPMNYRRHGQFLFLCRLEVLHRIYRFSFICLHNQTLSFLGAGDQVVLLQHIIGAQHMHVNGTQFCFCPSLPAI